MKQESKKLVTQTGNGLCYLPTKRKHCFFFFPVQNQQGPADDNRLYNSHVLVDDSGSIVAVYRKVHLFDIDVKDGPKLKESDVCIPGGQIVPPINTPVGNIGLAIVFFLKNICFHGNLET